jgi:hypothetical protein
MLPLVKLILPAPATHSDGNAIVNTVKGSDRTALQTGRGPAHRPPQRGSRFLRPSLFQGDPTAMFQAVRVVGQLKAEVLEYR